MTAAKVTGDYSKYPEAIREIYPYIYGELCELRSNWEVYKRLFMTDEGLTKTLAECYGPTLGMLQRLLEESLFMSVACLTDKDQGKNKNLSIWTLEKKCAQWEPEVARIIRSGLEEIEHKLERIRLHRCKRLAHFDLDTSLGSFELPMVTYEDLKASMLRLENILSEVEFRVTGSTLSFQGLSGYELTGKFESSAFKLKVYDDLVNRGIIDSHGWQKIRSKLK